jgi:hypothetical protein
MTLSLLYTNNRSYAAIINVEDTPKIRQLVDSQFASVPSAKLSILKINDHEIISTCQDDKYVYYTVGGVTKKHVHAWFNELIGLKNVDYIDIAADMRIVVVTDSEIDKLISECEKVNSLRMQEIANKEENEEEKAAYLDDFSDDDHTDTTYDPWKSWQKRRDDEWMENYLKYLDSFEHCHLKTMYPCVGVRRGKLVVNEISEVRDGSWE